MRVLVPLSLIVVALAGCFGGGGEGSASFYIHDAPTDEFDEIHVVFTRVEVHASGGTSDGGWQTIVENATGIDVDLLQASGGAKAFLGEADLAAGNYTQIRITVDAAYGIGADGNRTDFTVSSGTLRLVRGFEVLAGQESRISADLDLDRSLHEQGNGQWRMTPVLGKTTVEIVEDSQSGADTDTVGQITS